MFVCCLDKMTTSSTIIILKILISILIKSYNNREKNMVQDEDMSRPFGNVSGESGINISLIS